MRRAIKPLRRGKRETNRMQIAMKRRKSAAAKLNAESAARWLFRLLDGRAGAPSRQ